MNYYLFEYIFIFVGVLDSQQNWAESTEFLYTPMTRLPTHTQPPHCQHPTSGPSVPISETTLAHHITQSL